MHIQKNFVASFHFSLWINIFFCNLLLFDLFFDTSFMVGKWQSDPLHKRAIIGSNSTEIDEFCLKAIAV